MLCSNFNLLTLCLIFLYTRSTQVQSRRDGEVLRVKKHYLKLYLATRGIHSVASPIGEPEELSTPWANNSSSSSSTKSDDVAPSNDYESSPMKGPVTEETLDNDVSSFNNSNAVSPMAGSKSSSSSSSSRVRSLTCTDLDREDEITEQCSRKRARTSSGNMAKGEEEWRKACLNAKSLFCESLPGLEEAARMFGYASCQ